MGMPAKKMKKDSADRMEQYIQSISSGGYAAEELVVVKTIVKPKKGY